MANLPSGNMLPTTSTSAIIYVWCILIIILSSYSGQHGYGAHAWITDVQPTLKIKYGKQFAVLWFYYYPSIIILGAEQQSIKARHCHKTSEKEKKQTCSSESEDYRTIKWEFFWSRVLFWLHTFKENPNLVFFHNFCIHKQIKNGQYFTAISPIITKFWTKMTIQCWLEHGKWRSMRR